MSLALNNWAQVFIRIIIFYKEGGGRSLEATVFDNSWKTFEIHVFKFSSDDRNLDI